MPKRRTATTTRPKAARDAAQPPPQAEPLTPEALTPEPLTPDPPTPEPPPPAGAVSPDPPTTGPTGLGHEPAFTAATITGVTTALISLGVAYGLPVPDDAQTAIIGITGTVAPFIAATVTRRKVTPTG